MFDVWHNFTYVLFLLRVELSICLLYHNSSSLNIASSIWLKVIITQHLLKFIIEVVHPAYTPTFNLIVQRDKHNSILSFENKFWPRIMSYRAFYCKSFTWKIHIMIFAASNYGSINYNIFGICCQKVTTLGDPCYQLGILVM